MTKPILRKLSKAVAIFFSIWFFSCNIANPPEYVNKTAHAPALKQFAIHGVQPGQLITGLVTIKIDSLQPTPKIWEVNLFVSNTFLIGQGGSGSSYILTFDSRKVPDGLDTISIHFLLDHDSTLGLLNGNIQYTSNDFRYEVNIPVVVNNTPPAPVQNAQCTFNGHPVLSWDSSQDKYFRAYIVRRYWPSTLTDTIFDRNTTTFSDRSVQQICGTYLSYGISVWNGHVESAVDSINSVYDATVLQQGLCQFISANPNRNEVYVATRNDLNVALWSFSTKTSSLLHSLPDMGNAVDFSLTPDGTTLSYWNIDTHSIKRLHTADFNSLPDIPISDYGDYPLTMAVGSNWTVTATIYNNLELLNLSTGKTTDERKNFFDHNSTYSIVLSNDGNTAFAAFGDILYKIDLSLGSLEISMQHSFTEPIYAVSLVPGTGLIALQFYSNVSILQTSDFSNQTNFDLNGRNIQGLCMSGGNIYIASAFYDGSGSTPNGTVTEYNETSGTENRNWTFQSPSTGLTVSSDDNYLYVGNFLFKPVNSSYVTLAINLK